jgi:HPt (histidine-containing phosphotransfer) domain-containing protein
MLYLAQKSHISCDDSFPSMASMLHIDWDYLHLVSNHCPDFEIDLLKTLTDLLPAYLQILHTNLQLEDFDDVARTAHCIMGASASSGVLALQDIAACIEHQAYLRQREDIEQLLADFKLVFETLKSFVTVAEVVV